MIVCDDEDRENEGDLIMPCEFATESALAFMVNYTSGVICVGMEDDRCKELQLPPMVTNNEDPKCTAFTVSVDCKIGTTTGISAADRALTIRQLANPSAKPTDFTRPGHIFPLRAVAGGVLQRGGHTEASVDLARLAGCQPTGFLSEIVNKDGTMMRRPDLEVLSKEFDIKMITIEALKKYRLELEGEDALLKVIAEQEKLEKIKSSHINNTSTTISFGQGNSTNITNIVASVGLGCVLGYVLASQKR